MDKDYDWLFWTDADSVITNPLIELTDWTDTDGRVWCQDWPTGINSGQMLVRCCVDQDMFNNRFPWVVLKADRVVCFAGALDKGRGTMFLGVSGVIPEYRGDGLQQLMIQRREEHARLLGFRELVSYVDPENYPSANNFIRCGFTLCKPWDRSLGPSYNFFRKKL